VAAVNAYLVSVLSVFPWQKMLSEMLKPVGNSPLGCRAERSRSVFYNINILCFLGKN
jgi:hypothetical protein